MTDVTAQAEITLSDSAKAIIEGIEKMTVLELSQLVKALEDKFGVVAADRLDAAGQPLVG